MIWSFRPDWIYDLPMSSWYPGTSSFSNGDCLFVHLALLILSKVVNCVDFEENGILGNCQVLLYGGGIITSFHREFKWISSNIFKFYILAISESKQALIFMFSWEMQLNVSFASVCVPKVRCAISRYCHKLYKGFS